jgi:hypothetical protein
MNWGRANQERRVSDRGVSNVADEKELFKSDRAARWLNRAEPGKPTRQQYSPQPAKTTRQQPHKPKSGKGKTTVIPRDGDPCPRCGVPMEIHEHNSVGDKQLRQRSYYTRWFRCANKSCKTTQIMPPRYKVMNSIVRSDPGSDNMIVQQPEPADPNEPPPWE